MSILRKIHAVTEIGAMIAQSVSAVIQARAMRNESNADERLSAIEEFMSQIRIVRGRGKK